MGDVTYAQVRGNLNARIASGEFQTVERAHMPGRQFTTAKTIAAEHEIVSRVREGRNQVEPVLSRSQAISIADQHQHLNRTQRSVVEDVLEFARPHSGHPGFRRLGQDHDAFCHPQCRRDLRGIRSRALRQLPAPRASLARRALRPEPCKDSLPGQQLRRLQSRSISTLSMNRALPAPTRCANFLPVSLLRTVCC